VSDGRIALLSDVHGNTHALDAVLADADAVGVDEIWALGDLVALGPDPAGVLDRLTARPNVRFVRGNTDRYVVSGERPPPSVEEVEANPAQARVLAEVSASFAWTAGVLAASQWHDWLTDLPSAQRVELPDGSRLLGVHADPTRDDGAGLGAHVPAAQVAAAVAGCDADMVCAGHTHRPYDAFVDGTRVVNLGSVSNPHPPDLRASYVVIDAGSHPCTVEHRRADYDRAAVIDLLERRRHPGRAWIIAHLRGELTAPA
jgi:predicted phosphodiesterase